MTSTTKDGPREESDRRADERRKAARPATGDDRRQGERRTGHDRRNDPR